MINGGNNHRQKGSFVGQIAFVTGGSSGIGLETAKALTSRGAHVWLMARHQADLEKALTQVESKRQSPEQEFGFVVGDVSDYDQVCASIEQLTKAVGFPDLVINSAGVTRPGYFQELELEIFHQMMDINYFGTVNIAKAVVPKMTERGSGHIVNISSIAGFLGVFGYTAYGASKYAVRGFSDALRAEMKPHGISVSIVFPPDTDTPQLAYDNQFKPAETKALVGNTTILSAEKVAEAIVRGIIRKRYIILPGLEGSVLYWLSGLVGSATYPIMDWMIARGKKSK
jgi:3-dehydrosphinganine reductase